jgi:hypothetical protein
MLREELSMDLADIHQEKRLATYRLKNGYTSDHLFLNSSVLGKPHLGYEDSKAPLIATKNGEV